MTNDLPDALIDFMGVAPSGAKMKHGQRRSIPATPANKGQRAKTRLEKLLQEQKP